MSICNYCGEKEVLAFRCYECGNTFCRKHKVPESHNCPNCPTYKPSNSRKIIKKTPLERVNESIFRMDKDNPARRRKDE